jgi:hypothetical protein
VHVKSRRVDPFGAKCRDMERKILAAKRPGKVRARKEKRRANSSERVRMNHLLSEAKHLGGGVGCEHQCTCVVCLGLMEFVAPTTFKHWTFEYSIKRARQGDDHDEPILRWFVMHLRDNDADTVNRFADVAFSDSVSGRHARFHAIMIFGRWNGFDYPKEFLGWSELMSDDWMRKRWGGAYGLGNAGQSPDDL